MANRHYRVIVFVAVAASLLVVANSRFASGAESIVRLALTTLPVKLANPYASIGYPTITTTSAIFDGLVRLDRSGAIEPGLALSWTNVDQRTWRFNLRPGVTFSNGRPFDAEAVVAAVEHLAGPASATDFLKNELPAMTGARAVGPLTVEITTAGPEPLFPRHAVGLMIAEPDAWRRLGRDAFARAPVGTGPFELETWSAGRVRMKAFQASWRSPISAGLELIEIPDRTSRVQSLISGQTDIALDLGPDDVAVIEAAGGSGMSWSDGGVHGISFATGRDTPFADVRVRQALNFGVNKSVIVEQVLKGATVVAGQPAARLAFGYDPALKPYPYDPERAKRLLADAGYPKGFKFVLDATTSGPAVDLTYQLIAADLRNIGVEMTINTVPRGQFLANVFATGKFADAFGMWWGTQPSLDALRGVRLHSCVQQFAWFCDPALTPKIEAAMTTWGESDAVKLRHEILGIYRERAPAIFLYETVLFAGLAGGVRGYEDDFGFVRYELIDTSARR